MIHKIIHIDMDAFFVSVEELDNPSLKGKPVVVGHDGPRGVVSTANYVARQYGVHSALPIAVAHRLCPSLVVVEPHFSRYKEVSRQVHAIFHEYTDIIEPLSLDEAYLDVTDNKRGMDMAVDMAREIKQRIKELTGLTASAGVSYCKFLAKVASDFRKPDGLCTVHPERAIEFIDNLKVEQLWGVGEKTAQHMHRLGVYTGKQLRALTLQQLTAQFGKMGRVFYDFARGIDDLVLVVDAVDRGLHVDGGTLGLELLLGLIEQTVGTTDLVADPQGHAAAQEADVGVGVERDDFVALVMVKDGIDGGGAGMVGTNDNDLAHGRPLSAEV